MLAHMQHDDLTWDKLREQDCAYLIDKARKVKPTSASLKNVDFDDYMEAQVHLPYLAVKLGMPVYCVTGIEWETEKFYHMRFDEYGAAHAFDTEAAMLAEMNQFQPTRLIQCPPLFKLVGNHWSLHLPQGTYSDTTRLEASKTWFYDLFALS